MIIEPCIIIRVQQYVSNLTLEKLQFTFKDTEEVEILAPFYVFSRSMHYLT